MALVVMAAPVAGPPETAGFLASVVMQALVAWVEPGPLALRASLEATAAMAAPGAQVVAAALVARALPREPMGQVVTVAQGAQVVAVPMAVKELGKTAATAGMAVQAARQALVEETLYLAVLASAGMLVPAEMGAAV